MELAFLSIIYWQRSVFIIIFQVSLPWYRTFCKILYSTIPAVLGKCNTPWPQQWQKQVRSRWNKFGRGVFFRFCNTLVSSKHAVFFQMNSPSVSVAFRQSSEACGKYHGSSLLIVWAVTVPRRVCLIFSASACLFPQCFVSVEGGMSYSSLDLVIKTQVLDEAKQMAVLSCSGVCIRHSLTESISGEEIYFLVSIFATKHLQLA